MIRADAALSKLQLSYPDVDDNVQAMIEYMLTDMRHFCDKLGLDFSAHVKTAHQVYLQEKQ